MGLIKTHILCVARHRAHLDLLGSRASYRSNGSTLLCADWNRCRYSCVYIFLEASSPMENVPMWLASWDSEKNHNTLLAPQSLATRALTHLRAAFRSHSLGCKCFRPWQSKSRGILISTRSILCQTCWERRISRKRKLGHAWLLYNFATPPDRLCILVISSLPRSRGIGGCSCTAKS